METHNTNAVSRATLLHYRYFRPLSLLFLGELKGRTQHIIPNISNVSNCMQYFVDVDVDVECILAQVKRLFASLTHM